jgi:hypothetical protein
MSQPNFQLGAQAAGVISTDYDNMSQEDLDKLINDTIRVKTGRPGRYNTAPLPPSKRYVDLDAIIRDSE